MLLVTRAMASPLASEKQTVSLAPSGMRVSRIRRDPPPQVKEETIAERDERDTRIVIIGILTFTLALLVIGVAISSYLGWSPRQYTAYF